MSVRVEEPLEVNIELRNLHGDVQVKLTWTVYHAAAWKDVEQT